MDHAFERLTSRAGTSLQRVRNSSQIFLPHDDRPHGYILPSIVAKMPWTQDFAIDNARRIVQLLDVSDGAETSAICNAVFQKVVNGIVDQNLFTIVHAQHSELVQVSRTKYPVRVERFATPLFGFAMRGAHLTAYTQSATGMKIWVAPRSLNVKMYLGMLDSTVTGGIKARESTFDTIIHEVDEEASLLEEHVRRGATTCGTLMYIGVSGEQDLGENGLVCPDIIYVHDIELQVEVVSKPKDEEVETFYFMDIDQVKKALAAREFESNSAVVMIDFFARHGIVTVENEGDFAEVCERMYRKMPFVSSDGKT